jgi:hypothetical protein
MATRIPSTSARGGAQEKFVRPAVPLNEAEAPRCACGVVLWAVISIALGTCAACRTQARASMSLEELRALAHEYQLAAARLWRVKALDSAADFEMEARIVEAELAQREDISNA